LGAILGQNFIQEKVNDFSLIKTGFRITVRLTASRFIYGKVMLVYSPNPDMDGHDGTQNIYTASGYPHMLVDAAASEAAVFDIPFITPKRAVDLDDYTAEELGRLTLLVLNPLHNILGEPDTCQIMVTGQLLEASVALPQGPLGTNSSFVKVKVRKESREARVKATRNLISSHLEDHTPELGHLKAPSFVKPFVGMFNRIAKPLETAALVATMFGLSKPTTVEPPKIVALDATNGFAYGKGIDLSKKYAMDPEAGVSTAPVLGGIDADEMDLSYIVSTPMMTSQYALINGSPITLVGTSNPYALLAQYTYVDFVTRNFRFCSGSYKFCAYITASTMHAVKLVFYVAKNSSTDWQNCYQRVVDVQGSTEVQFVLPYCVSDVTRDTTIETEYWSVYVQILAWSQPDPSVSSPIYVNVYKAGASDFRFGQLMDMQFIPQSNPRQDFSKNFEPFHPSMVGYVPDNVIYPEEYKTVREIIHRMYPGFSVYPNTEYELYRISGPWIGKELWGLLFMFWRGGVRVKYLQRDVERILLQARNDDGVIIPGVDISLPDKPTVEAEIPYYSNQLYKSTSVVPAQAGVIQTYAFGGTDQLYYCSAGADDFSFHFLRPPPTGTLAPTTSGLGYAGLASYFEGTP